MGILFTYIDSIIKGTDFKGLKEMISNGGLYLNGVALLVSYSGSFIIDFLINKKDVKFIYMKITSIAVSMVLVMLLSAGYLSIYTASRITNEGIKFQVVIYFLSILVCLYSFCISCMETKVLYEDYNIYDDNNTQRVISNGNNACDDGEGAVL